MKPLLRWTMGNVASLGWTVLRESIRHLPKVYPEFDYIICHNNLDPGEEAYLASFGIPLHKQMESEVGFAFKNQQNQKVNDFAWKLVPPRLRPEAHELWVDNDIVIRDRIPELNLWLKSNTGIISRGINPDYGRYTMQMTDRKDVFCAGFFGLPPFFDFNQKLLEYIGIQPLTGFDEQGLVSMIVSEMEGCIVVPQQNLILLSEFWRWRPAALPPAAHFARSNRRTVHKSWRAYVLATTPGV